MEQSFATVVNAVYTVTFDQGASPLYGDCELEVTAAGQSQTYFEAMTGATHWTNKTFVFTANTTLTTLRIEESAAGVGSIWSGLDNVVVTVVPEPATIAALGLGALVILRKRR